MVFVSFKLYLLLGIVEKPVGNGLDRSKNLVFIMDKISFYATK